MEEAKFPLFRRYYKEPVFFRVDSDNKYTEIKLIGDKLYTLETRVCSMFPDLLFIQDLIACKELIEGIQPAEYAAILKQAEYERTRI